VSEIAPYDDEELNEHGLRLRCRDLRADNARLAARVKVLEEALEEVGTWHVREDARCWCAIPEMIPYRGHDGGCEAARAALVTDGGGE
jgi:hypothetical protein